MMAITCLLDEKEDFLKKEPHAEPYFHRWLGGVEFINNIERYYLCLGECDPNDLKKLADTPTRFHTECIPLNTYLAMPQVSSERRQFIPISFLQPGLLCGDKLKIVQNATLYHFGVINSGVMTKKCNCITLQLSVSCCVWRIVL